MVEQTHHPELDLMVYTVSGSFGPDDLRAVSDAFYGLEAPPSLVLWDLAGAKQADFTARSMERVQKELRRKTHSREGGKTAVVAPGDLLFGMARQYLTLASSEGFPFAQQVFRTLEEACAWLGMEPAALEGEG